MIAERTPDPNVRSSEMSDQCVAELATAFKVLGDETRLRIVLDIRRNGELNVTELMGLLEMSQPLVSHHVAILRDAGMLAMRRQGKHNYYQLRPGYFEKLMRSLALYNPSQPLCERFLQCVFC